MSFFMFVSPKDRFNGVEQKRSEAAKAPLVINGQILNQRIFFEAL
jgi:hypothetical protein